MQTNDVIEYTDSDGHQRRVVVGELLSAEEIKELLQSAARKAGVATFDGDYERDHEDILADLEGKVDDDDLACTLTGAINADVSLYLTPLDLAADAARQEAYDQAVSSLEFTIDRILAGRDESDIPVYDDNPDDLVGEWIYTGNVGYNDEGIHLCYRWHADLPDGVEFDDQCFEVNSPTPTGETWTTEPSSSLTDRERDWMSGSASRSPRKGWGSERPGADRHPGTGRRGWR